MHVMLIEPPKDFWFIMGKYMPPPFGILCLAAFLEENHPDVDITVVDSQAEGLDWNNLEDRLEKTDPDIVAPSSLATANSFYSIRTAGLAKKINPEIATVVGGQHFTALAEETLREFKVVDYVVRGEGEVTFTELVEKLDKDEGVDSVKGLSYRIGDNFFHNADRSLIPNLDGLPLPAYHLVEEHMKDYYFALMADHSKPFAIVEGSRGCRHNCSYCSQWCFWGSSRRLKSPGRVVEEFQVLYEKYGSRFFWFTDDNFGLGPRNREICEGLIDSGLGEEIEWFCQVRGDDVVNNPVTLDLMRKAGCMWALLGFDNPSEVVMNDFHRSGLGMDESREMVKLLRENGIFSQGTFIIGHREDSHETIDALRKYADHLDPDIASFFVLTPFPGTELFEEAKKEGKIEDYNWANYDMVHAIMPTRHLSREELQRELYDCYDSFFGSWARRYRGMTSNNPITRRTYSYLAKQALLSELKIL